MTIQGCKRSATAQRKLLLHSSLGVAARIVLLATPVWAMPLIDVAKSAVIFVSNFESGFSEWGKELCCAHSATIVTSPVRAGKQAIKFTLNKSDPDVASSKRAELKRGTVPANSEEWYGFSLLLPLNYTADPSYEIIAQWHEYPDKNLGETWRTPPLYIKTQKGKLYLQRRWDPNKVTKNNTPGSGGGIESILIGPYKTGEWTEFVFHIKWSYKSDGLLEVWQNGNLIVRKAGPNTYNDQVGPYFKMGVYKPEWKSNPSMSNTTQRVVYFDEVRVGNASTSYTDVASGASPTSTPTPSPIPTPSPAPTPSPTPSPIPGQVGGIRFEAEQMFLSAYRIESGERVATGSSLISLYSAPATTDTASSTFSGSSGKYDVFVGYFDEDDGVASLKVKLGGAQIASWQLNQKLGDGNASAKTLVRQKVASGVSINKGAKIEITGTANNTEWARVDYIEFVPVL